MATALYKSWPCPLQNLHNSKTSLTQLWRQCFSPTSTADGGTEINKISFFADKPTVGEQHCT